MVLTPRLLLLAHQSLATSARAVAAKSVGNEKWNEPAKGVPFMETAGDGRKEMGEVVRIYLGMGQNLATRNWTAGFSPWLHLPGQPILGTHY